MSEKLKVLIVGSGGREHALAWKCKQSSLVGEINITPGNGGTATIGENWNLSDQTAIIAKIKERKIDLVIVGQEVYLINGLADELEKEGIKVFGPSAKAAQIEGSKAFSKDFMARHHIPTATYRNFDKAQDALDWLDTLNAPYVIKADGLAAGKGALICPDLESAQKAIDDIMVKKVFGTAGNRVVIEEFMEGEEASYFVITDGKDFKPLPSLQDHKRIFELDRGPNTGGMGCYAPATVVDNLIEKKIIDKVVIPTLRGMESDGHPYKGVLYVGLMIKDGEPRVVEYNCRFGDPECQPLMMLLDTDFVSIALAVAENKLGQLDVQCKDESAACVVLASGGYPEQYQTGYTIQGLEEIETDNATAIFHAGTKKEGNRFLTGGGRVLNVTCLGANLTESLNNAYTAAKKIYWPGVQYRRDIGIKGLKRETNGREGKKLVGIFIGSASDKPIAKKAVKIFDQFEIGYTVNVSSAHRTPQQTRALIQQMQAEGTEVFIAIAGMAAHLPGVIAAETNLPVIGVPVNASLNGLDALYAIVQMPPGIPVATVGVDRGDNAAILAAQILSLKYPDIGARHREYRLEMEYKVYESQKEVDDLNHNF